LLSYPCHWYPAKVAEGDGDGLAAGVYVSVTVSALVLSSVGSLTLADTVHWPAAVAGNGVRET
jgi:hypothetical protein